MLLVALALTAGHASPSIRGGAPNARQLLGGLPDLSAMGLPFKKDAVMAILSGGKCDLGELMGLLPVFTELGTKLKDIASPADIGPILEKDGAKVMDGLCAKATCPAAIVAQLDPAQLPAQLTPAVLSLAASKICTRNAAATGYCALEAAEDALTTVALALADPANLPTRVAGGDATICKSGCYAVLGKDFLVEAKGLVEAVVGQTFDQGFADVATMCDASAPAAPTPAPATAPPTPAATDGGKTGDSTDSTNNGATGTTTNNDDEKKDADAEKEEAPDGEKITDKKWFLPAVIGGGCALVAAVAFAAVCLSKKHAKNTNGHPESMTAPLTPRTKAHKETGAPITSTSV